MERERIEFFIREAVKEYLPEKIGKNEDNFEILGIEISDCFTSVVVVFVGGIAFLDCEVMKMLSGDSDKIRVGLRLVTLL